MPDHSTAFVDSLSSSNVHSPYRYPRISQSNEGGGGGGGGGSDRFDVSSSARSPPSRGRSSQSSSYPSSGSSRRRTTESQDATESASSSGRTGYANHVLKHLHSPASATRYKKSNVLQESTKRDHSESTNNQPPPSSSSSSKSQKLLLRSPPIKKRRVEEIWVDEHDVIDRTTSLNTPAATPSRKPILKSASRDGRKDSEGRKRGPSGGRGREVDDKSDVNDIMETNELMMASPGVFRSPVVGNRHYSNLPLSVRLCSFLNSKYNVIDSNVHLLYAFPSYYFF